MCRNEGDKVIWKNMQTKARQVLLCSSVAALPRTKSTDFARVSATFTRLSFLRKPMLPLARTHENMIKSFSLPWKLSIVVTSTYGEVWGAEVLSKNREKPRNKQKRNTGHTLSFLVAVPVLNCRLISATCMEKCTALAVEVVLFGCKSQLHHTQ